MSAINGYIKLHRKFIEWEWYSDEVVRSVFLHLLLTATYKPIRFQGTELAPGDVVIGREKMAKELGFSQQQIRTALKKLENTGEIFKKSTNRFSVATLVNWGVYQGLDEDEQPTINQQSTNNQPTINQQSTTFKNIRNKEYKNIYIYGGGGEYNNAPVCVELWQYKEMTDELRKEVIGFTNKLFARYTSQYPTEADVYRGYNRTRSRGPDGHFFDTDKQGLLEYAFDQALTHGKPNWNYVEGILDKLHERGLRTKDDCEFYDMTEGV